MLDLTEHEEIVIDNEDETNDDFYQIESSSTIGVYLDYETTSYSHPYCLVRKV